MGYLSGAGFTVRTRSGVNYCAQGLAVGWRNGDCAAVVTFMCSGHPMTVPAEDVVDIDFASSGQAWCPHCDRPITLMGGVLPPPKYVPPATGEPADENPPDDKIPLAMP